MYGRTIIVTVATRSKYFGLLDDLAQIRHRIFVEQLGWDLPLAANGRELDQFDDERAIYVVTLDIRGGIRAAVRLHDTGGPTLLNTVYQRLLSGPVPMSASVWEGTRMLVHPDLAGADAAMAFRELLEACVSFGISQGITGWVSVSDPILERVLRRAGAAPRRLGPVLEVQPGVCALALEMDCDPATLCRIREGLAILRQHEPGHGQAAA